MDRHRFHATVHARPWRFEFAESCVIEDRSVRPLRIAPEMLANPMAVSFEEAVAALEILPRMFIEPDGSFVWTSESGERSWQVDGVLYDRGGYLLFVDLRGECARPALRRLITGFGAEQTPVMFQLVRQAVFLDEEAFLGFTRLDGDPD